MALTKCQDCGKERSTAATSCPNCGRVVVVHEGFAHKFLRIIFFAVLLIVLINLSTCLDALQRSKS